MSVICLECCGCSSMVEHQPSKLVVRVRFPSPAPRVWYELENYRGNKNGRKEKICKKQTAC